MNISKTLFKELLRCDRFSALLEMMKEGDDAIISFSSHASIEELESLEHKSKLKILADQLHEAGFDEDEEIIEDPMLPYFNQLEDITSDWVTKRFGHDVISRKANEHQKHISLDLDFDSLHAFLDVYQEDLDKVRIFEVKATTDKKFINETFSYKKDGEKIEFPLFINKDGIHHVFTQDNPEIESIIIKKLEKLWKPSAKTYPYLYDIAFQAYIANHSKEINKELEFYLVTLNKAYVYDGVEIKDDIITIIDVTKIIHMMEPIIIRDIELVINRVDHQNASPIPLGTFCKFGKRDACPFIPICYKDFPDNKHMLTYIDRHNGYLNQKKGEYTHVFEWINQGITDALDFPLEYLNEDFYDNPTRIKKNKSQYEIIEKYLKHQDETPFVRKDEIKQIVQTYKYPIYYLDFESFPSPIPRFKGETPYTQSVFQFSVHVEKEPGKCDRDKDHIGYVAPSVDDHRLELVEKLCSAIPQDRGTVLVWFEAFEKGRLEELANLFPKYRKHLLDIRSRVKDLMKVFKGDKEFLGDSMFNYYHHGLEGSFSIKKVLPTLTSINYHDLNVKNGGEAMSVYAEFPKMKKDELEQALINLTEYCKLDTYAMVLLKQIILEKIK